MLHVLRNSLLLLFASSLRCLPVSDPSASEQNPLISVPAATLRQSTSVIRLREGSLARYLEDSLRLLSIRVAHTPPVGQWRMLSTADVRLDSLTETLVNEEGSPKFLLYNIVYPVFQLHPVATPTTALNAYYRAAYSKPLVRDTIRPRLATWLRQRPTRKKRRYDGQESAVDYEVRPFCNSLYITAKQDTFLSSVGAYTSEVGSGNLSGFVFYSVQLTHPIQDVSVLLEQSLTRQPWPELDALVQQRLSVSFLQLPETTGLGCSYFFAPQGLLIGVNWTDRQREDTEAFIIEIPYATLTQRLQVIR